MPVSDPVNSPPSAPASAPDGHLGETILALIQAFLKTGYYTSGHPETQRARAGLYDEVRVYLDGHSEITFIIVADGERREIYLAGLRNDPIPLSSLMLKSMAELFIPKFAEYFERKSLASFSLKSAISQREFEAFVDLMTEPPLAADSPEAARDRLTADLVRLDIVMVSTVFNVDLVGMGRKLPWRIKNILSRLKRDLNLLPLYHNLGATRLAEIHRMVLGDIIRPLRNVKLLSELFLNLDLIGFDLAGFEPDQLEGMLLELLPAELKAPVAAELARSMGDLQQSFEQLQDVELLVRKEYLRGTLQRMGRELLAAGRFDADLFGQLVSDGILRVDDLPPELQERLAEGRLREQFAADPQQYLARLAALPPEPARQRLLAVREELPELVRSGRLPEVAALCAAAATLQPVVDFAEDEALVSATLAAARQRFAGNKDEQTALLDLLAGLGPFGCALLAELLDIDNRYVRRGVLERLQRLGPVVLAPVLAVLPRRGGWFYLRNTLLVLTRVAPTAGETMQLLRRSLSHAEANVRREAVQGFTALPAAEAIPLLLPLLKDPSAEVRQRTLAVLGRHGCVHSTMLTTLQRIVSGGSAEPLLLEQALKTLALLPLPAAQRPVFAGLLGDLLIERELFGLRHKATDLRPELKVAALAALGLIGGDKVPGLLRRFCSDAQPPVAAAAREALRRSGAG